MAEPSVEERISAALQPVEPVEERPVERSVDPAAPISDETPIPTPAEPEAAEAAPEEAPSEDAPDEEVLEVESLADLAEHFNLNPADLYNLKIPVTSEDGERAEVTIGEFKDSFRAKEAAEAATRQATQQRQALEARQAEIEQQWEARIQETAATLQVAEQHLSQEFQGIDWRTLQAEDPGEYAAKRLAFNERANALEQAKHQLVQTWTQAKNAQDTQAAQHRAQALEREQQAMLKAIPEWRDEDAAKLERAELSTYLESSGFGPDEVGSIADHRLVVMARKAMLYDKHVKVADATKKRVVRLSSKKPLKPNARQSSEERQADSLTAARNKLKKTGHWQDAAALISAASRRE